MKIRIITVGKKHEPWIKEGINRFLVRLRQPFDANFEYIVNSPRNGQAAREEESGKILKLIKGEEFIILLDERGKNITSTELSGLLSTNVDKQIVIIIGGAYGVDENLRNRANFTWSLSNLVFPHQLVRLILAEQLYRAQEIHKGSGYHHA